MVSFVPRLLSSRFLPTDAAASVAVAVAVAVAGSICLLVRSCGGICRDLSGPIVPPNRSLRDNALVGLPEGLFSGLTSLVKL